jgi:hypothetical protein
MVAAPLDYNHDPLNGSAAAMRRFFHITDGKLFIGISLPDNFRYVLTSAIKEEKS